MATLDVTELFTDPDFTDPITVVRRVQIMTAGIVSSVNTNYPNVIAVVQPASGATMMQRPDLATSTDVIEIWSKFAFQQANESQLADLIIWKNNTYINAGLMKDWQHFGQGYTHIVATLHTLVQGQ